MKNEKLRWEEGTEGRKYGLTERRIYGETEVRKYGLTERRIYGETEVRKYGLMERRSDGNMDERVEMFLVNQNKYKFIWYFARFRLTLKRYSALYHALYGMNIPRVEEVTG